MRERLRTHALGVAGREAAAFARQALLLRHDVAEPVLPADARDGDDVVVLRHGLFATAGVLRPMRAAIERQAPGASGSGPARAPGGAAAILTAAISYPPGPGVEALAERLGDALSALPAGARLHLCGHSVGGIVCRFYAQEAGDARVAQTISMATPFGGIPGARFLGFGGARDIDPSSPVLRRILLGAARSPIPHLSIVAADDTLIRSPIAHALPSGEVRVMAACGHNTLLFDPDVAALIVRRVLDLRPSARGASPAPPHGPGGAPTAIE
ncbi:MAG: hypothetical protein IT372_26845 [Polyangiaceae bacterium]|nr:hypothetical protein [Polyangiaceae bacterium]